jgi:hypothetical protein
VIAQRRRFNVVDCGRRWGKSLLGLDLATDMALDAYPVGWFAPTYKDLGESWRDASKLLFPIIKRKNETEKRLELITGGVIEFWSLSDNPDAGRSRKYKRVIIDEAAKAGNLKEAWEGAIRPTLADYQGDAFFFSTPKGLNYFYELYRRDGQPDWKAWQLPTSANPYIVPAEIEAARRDLPDRVFQQEYLAAFLENGALFSGVRELSTLARREPDPKDTRQYLIGADWGKRSDRTVFSIWDIAERKEIALHTLGNTMYTVQIAEVVRLAKAYNDALIIGEANSIGDPIIEQIAIAGARVMEFLTTAATKAYGVQSLCLACENKSITFQEDADGLAEMELFEYQGASLNGLPKYSAPEGFHDDVVMARVIAYSGIAQSGPVLLE